MKTHRQNERQDTPARTQRCYSVNGLWYFELRGGGQHGPYDSEQEMKQALEEFIGLHEEMKKREQH